MRSMTARLGRIFADQRVLVTAFVVALLLILVAVSIPYAQKAEQGRWATARWLHPLQEMEGGVNIHQKYSYPNPPIMAIMLWPISKLMTIHPIVGALTWFYLKIAMAAFCVIWAFRLIETPERPFPVWAKML